MDSGLELDWAFYHFKMWVSGPKIEGMLPDTIWYLRLGDCSWILRWARLKVGVLGGLIMRLWNKEIGKQHKLRKKKKKKKKGKRKIG